MAAYAEGSETPWTHAELTSSAVTTRHIVDFIQAHASDSFLESHHLGGKPDVLAKNRKKPALITAYEELISTKDFKTLPSVEGVSIADASPAETDAPAAGDAPDAAETGDAAAAACPAPARPWSAEEMATEAVTKRAIVDWLKANATYALLDRHKMAGPTAEACAKNRKKPELVAAVEDVFASQGWREPGSELVAPAAPKPAVVKSVLAAPVAKAKAKAAPPAEAPHYRKSVTKKGDAANKPVKGDTVHVWYTGKLPDGSVFDSNQTKTRGSTPKPLAFRVGVGQVIRGWDEALLTMGVGEVATINIDADWAYGKKGKEGLIPPNTPLTFDVELVKIGK